MLTQSLLQELCPSPVTPTDYIPRNSHYQRADTYRSPVPAPTPTASFCFQNPVLPPLPATNLPHVPQFALDPRTQVLDDQLPLSNSWPIPNNGMAFGLNLKHRAETGLAAQSQDAPAPTQQVPFEYKVSPCPSTIDNCIPSAHTVQFIGAGKPEKDPEDPFTQILAAERKKLEVRQSTLPHMSTPSTSTARSRSRSTSAVPAAFDCSVAPTVSAASVVASAPVASISATPSTPASSAIVRTPPAPVDAAVRAASVPASPSICIAPAAPVASNSAAPAVSAASVSDMSTVAASAVAAPAVPVASALAAPSVSTVAVPAVAASATPPIPTATLPIISTVPVASAPVVPASSASAAPAPTTVSVPAQTIPQYRFQSSTEDQQLVSELQTWLMEGKLAQTTPAHVLAASPTIQRELIGKPQAEATGLEEVASAQTLTITCRPAPPPQPPPQQQSLSKPLSVTHPRSQQQHQSCHNHQSCLSHNKLESTSRVTNPSQQAPDVAVARPPVLKDPDKVACREAKNPAGAQSGVTVTSSTRAPLGARDQSLQGDCKPP